MIITHLTGGLGNQMFQYAAGLALAEAHRTVLKLDVSWFRKDPSYEGHNRYALSCFNITEQFATEEEIDRVRGVQWTRTERWSAQLARALRLYRYANRHAIRGNWHRPPTFAFYDSFFAQPDNTYLNGMFQSERFFSDIGGLLRLHFSFRYPPSPEVSSMAARIQSAGPSAAVHFRRGDYLRNPAFAAEIGALPLDYYHRALEYLDRAHPGLALFVFSDDMDWVEEHFQPARPCVYVRATGSSNPYDKIRLMALCHHAIISNSTFAWWGAWLNPSPSRMVIAPDPWFASGSPNDGKDVVPGPWVRIPRDGTTA